MDPDNKVESLLLSEHEVDNADNETASEIEEAQHAEPHDTVKIPGGPGGWIAWVWHKFVAAFEDAFWKAVILLIALGLLTTVRAFADWAVFAFAR